MKKLFYFSAILFAALFISCSEGYDDSVLAGRVDKLEDRVTKLEELCSRMNTNISSLQTIVNALQQNDYVTNVAPINKDGKTVGYTITFSKSGTITIYHGEDGKDGQNGTDGKDGIDGQDGHTPIIGVKQASDGIYYWTLDGEWLLDSDGNKIKAVGTDGKDGADGEDGSDGADGATGPQGPQGPAGADGEDGQDGQDGAVGPQGPAGADGKDGKDGITPQLKIENDYWYVSYDNGESWVQLGKATSEGAAGSNGSQGPQGEQGPQGPQGEKGDSFFQSVTQDANNVYFVLADGTTITIPKAASAENIELTYIPRYSDGKATVFYTEKSDSYVELDFEVSPASAAANWRNIATVKAVYTETRAGVEFVDMAILDWSTDTAKGTITVKASGKNLSDAFFVGSQDASARLVVNGNGVNIMSEYVPMVAAKSDATSTTPPYNEIWYTSTDGKVVNPKITDAFGANIVSNTYEDGKGVITFDVPINSIGESAFAECHNLKSMTLPNHVLNIGKSCFYGCSGLQDIKLSDKLEFIGAGAFQDCTSLTSLTIPESVIYITSTCPNCPNIKAFYGKFATSDNRSLIIEDKFVAFAAGCNATSYDIPDGIQTIGYGAFSASKLKNVTIPNSVNTIQHLAFYRCTELTEITIPNTVTIMGMQIFMECSSLANVTLGNNISGIWAGTFSYCSSLKSISIPDSVTSIGDKAFGECSSLESITIPNSVTLIGWCAFYGCQSLKNAIIGSGVKEIGYSAFEHCKSLNEVICKPTTPPTAMLLNGNWYTFNYIGTSAKIYVPVGSGAAYKAAAYWSDYASMIVEKNM